MPRTPETGREPGPALARVLTAPGEGGIAVLSLEGPSASAALDRLTGGRASQFPPDGIVRAWLVEEGRRIDEALLWRAGDAVEVGLHGGSAALAALLRALRRSGVSVTTAPPGTGPIERDAARLLPAAATLPAAMFLAAAAAGAVTRELQSGDPERVRACLARARTGAALATPRTVALSGPPNAGKSTLLNALCGRDRALAHPEAGTTRDPVEAVAEAGGYPLRFVDTAGLAGTADGPGGEAEARARAVVREADLVLWLADPSGPSPAPARADLRLSGKSDLGRTLPGALPVSGTTGDGIDALRQEIVRALGLPWPADPRPAPFLPHHAPPPSSPP